MTVLARSTSVGHELSIGPVTELADVNPATPLTGLGPDSLVSFIPMSDASESGQWIGRQTRKLRQVRSGYTPFREGDVLFAKITPCMENGKGCHAQGLVNGVGFGSTEFHVLRSKPTADARFLYHWLQSDMLRLAAEAMMTGSAGQRRVPSEFFSRLPIPLLPLHEQRHIAEILDTADRAIGETEVLISKLKQMKTGLMHDLLTRGLDERGHLRDPDAHPEQFKDSPLGRIPREWRIKQLSLCVRTDAPITYGIVQAGPHIESGVPYIRTGDMVSNRLKLDGLMRTSKRIASSYRRSEVRTGEIVCAIRATVGKVLEVPPELNSANLTQGTARIAPREDINNHFLLWALRSEIVKKQFDLAIKGTTFSEITLGELRKVLIPLPSSCIEQQRIAEILDVNDARIHAEEVYRDKLKLQKKGLMDDLLTGRVRVKTAQEVGA